jgi:hypothetical protein
MDTTVLVGSRHGFDDGRVLPGDAGSEQARRGSNGEIDRSPATFARCRGAGAVAGTIALALLLGVARPAPGAEPMPRALLLAAAPAAAKAPAALARHATAPQAFIRAPATSPNALWVTRMYGDLLSRAPDSATLDNFVSQLAHGTTRQQLATQLVSSPEYRMRVVSDLYALYLHRPPDAGAVSYWLAMIGSVGYLGIQERILSSSEYLKARGGGSIDGFLDALYQDVLGRKADAAAHANLVTQFGGTGVSQRTTVQGIVGSAQGRAALVNQLYSHLLHRTADQAGEAFFATHLGSGGSEESVLIAILSSNEYFQRRP